MLDLLVLELALVIGLFLLAGAARRSWAAPFRSWERRFGYPAPRRTAGGHRLYDESVFDRLSRIMKLKETILESFITKTSR